VPIRRPPFLDVAHAGLRIRKAREVRRSATSNPSQRDTAERMESADSTRLTTVLSAATAKRSVEDVLTGQLRAAREAEREAQEEVHAAQTQLAAARAEGAAAKRPRGRASVGKGGR